MECPIGMLYLWEYFHQLHSTRSAGMGLSAISYLEIWAWSTLLNIGITSSEVEIIKMLDSAYLTHYYETQQKKAK